MNEQSNQYNLQQPQQPQQQHQTVTPNAVAPQVVAWLNNVLSVDYVDPVRTAQDTIAVLSKYPTLSPKTNVYIDEQGRPDLLLCLGGTVPVLIGRATYRIPVEIWVTKTYPGVSSSSSFSSPPVVMYVRPTPDMIVHPGNHVDTNGKCYHPYISHWSNGGQDGNGSNLMGLIEVMINVFAKEPPVYAKPPDYREQQPGSNSQIDQYHHHQQQQQVQSVQPPPVAHSTHPQVLATHQRNLSTSSTVIPPPLPPHPTTTEQPLSIQNTGIQQPPPQTNQPPPQTNQLPPPPPLPPIPSELQQEGHQNTFPNSQYSHPIPIQNVQYQQQQQHFQQQQPPPPPPPPAPPIPLDIMDMTDPQEQQQQNASSPSSQLNSKIPTTNSSSSPPPPPPPPPPNPHKQHLLSTISTKLSDITLHTLQPMVAHNDTRVLQARETLAWMSRAVAHETTELERIAQASIENETILRAKIQQAKDVVMHQARDLETKLDTNPKKIDEIVCAENVVHNQLYELVAEICAIDDTVYVLSKALDMGRISLDTFLKHSRSLGREQFMKRALVHKISTKLELL